MLALKTSVRTFTYDEGTHKLQNIWDQVVTSRSGFVQGFFVCLFGLFFIKKYSSESLSFPSSVTYCDSSFLSYVGLSAYVYIPVNITEFLQLTSRNVNNNIFV